MQKVSGLTPVQRDGQQAPSPIGPRAQAPQASQFKPAQLQPQAQPVDTYARPERPPESNSLLQLAQSLGSINPSLQRFAKALQPTPEDSAAAFRGYLQRTPHDQVIKAFKSGTPPKEAQSLAAMRVMGEEMGYRDTQEFTRRYNTDFDKTKGNPDDLWREVSADTVKQFGKDRAFMEVYTKAADDGRRKVMSANEEYKAQEVVDTRKDVTFAAREGRVDNMLNEGKSGDEIAAALYADFAQNKEYLGIHPKEQQQQVLQIAERRFNLGQYDVARSILQYQRKDGAYQGSLMTDRELGDKASDLMVRIDREEQRTKLAASSAAEEETTYTNAMKLSDQGSVNAIGDVTVHDKQGEPKVLSGDTIRKEVARRTLETIRQKADYGAKTPEAKAALANKLEKESFIGNGQEHPVWFQTMKNAAAQLSLNALSKDGNIPPTALDAYKLYKELNDEAPQYLGKYLDEKSLNFFEQARVMQENGNVSGDQDALLSAMRTTADNNEQPEAMKFKYDDINSAVDDAVNDGTFWDSEASNKSFVAGELLKSAKVYARSGVSTEDALKQSWKSFQKTHINIAGTWLKNDKRLPGDFVDLTQQALNAFAEKHHDDLGIDANDITIDRFGNGTGAWIILDKATRQPLHVPSSERIITLQSLDDLRKANTDKVKEETIKAQNRR